MLVFLLACISASGEVFDYCVSHIELGCRCGDFSSNSEDAAGYCTLAEDEAALYEVCGDYDLRKCDPDRAQYDAAGCETAREMSEEAGTYLDWHQCIDREYSQACPGTDVTYDEWVSEIQEAKDACSDLQPPE